MLSLMQRRKYAASGKSAVSRRSAARQKNTRRFPQKGWNGRPERAILLLQPPPGTSRENAER